jgi:hypothetical protein
MCGCEPRRAIKFVWFIVMVHLNPKCLGMLLDISCCILHSLVSQKMEPQKI